MTSRELDDQRLASWGSSPTASAVPAAAATPESGNEHPLAVIRPHLARRIATAGFFVALFGLVALGGIESAKQLNGAAFVTAMMALNVGIAVKERVEVEERQIRVIRLFTSDVVERANVIGVARSAGRNKPKHLVQVDGSPEPCGAGHETTSAADREATMIKLPSYQSPRKLAIALGVPYLSFTGRPLAAHDPWWRRLADQDD